MIRYVTTQCRDCYKRKIWCFPVGICQPYVVLWCSNASDPVNHVLVSTYLFSILVQTHSFTVLDTTSLYTRRPHQNYFFLKDQNYVSLSLTSNFKSAWKIYLFIIPIDKHFSRILISKSCEPYIMPKSVHTETPLIMLPVCIVNAYLRLLRPWF